MRKIAVLMSTYNGEDFLHEQIDSIVNQEGDFIVKLIVRDDGSSDETTAILNQYQSEHKLTWYQGKNLKPAKSFLELLYYSDEFDYYAFSDQDDVWEKDKLASGIARIEHIKRPAMYIGNAQVVDRELNVLQSLVSNKYPKLDYASVLTGATFALGCTMIMNNYLVDILKSGAFPAAISMHDTYMMRLCVAVGGVIQYDLTPHIEYRQHETNVLGYKTRKQSVIERIKQQILKKATVSIADTALEIISIHGDIIPSQIKSWMSKVATYRRNFFTRSALALSPRYHHDSLKHAIKNRLTIWLGNR